MKTKLRGLSEVCLLLFSVLFAARVWAAPPLVTIQDTLYRADGAPYSGFLVIEWKSFEAPDQSAIAMQELNLRIYNGQFKVRLVPTTTAPGASYRVRYVSDGKVQFTETWAVPPTSATLRVRDVRVAQAAGGGTGGGSAGASTQVNISDVIGLAEELEIRPRKGIGYQANRVAVINGLGEIDGALGGEEECVRVDGSGGACGNGGGVTSLGATFRDGETPGGAVDGVNAVFTLAATPNPAGSLLFYRNGLLMKNGVDYNLSGAQVTFVAGAVPQEDDILVASYRTSGTPAAYSLVLCASAGTAVSGNSFASLGTCTVPAGVLQPGDRIEIVYDLSHEGTAVDGEFEVRAGGTAILARAFPAAEAYASGRVGMSVGTGTLQWHSESWGKTLAAAFDAGNLAVDPANALGIEFRARMNSAGGESLTLRNYTVIRHPRP